MRTASAGRRGNTIARSRSATARDEGWLWGEPTPSATAALDAVNERRSGGALLREAFDQAQDAMLVVDADRRVCHLNQSAARRLGLRKGALLLPGAGTAANGLTGVLRQVLDAVLRGEAVRDLACPGWREGGQARAGRMSCWPVRDAKGRVTAAICTLREQAEDPPAAGGLAERLRRESGRLVHDYNNALTVLLGNLSMAAEVVKGPAAELLRAAQQGALAARRLTEELPDRLRDAAEPARQEVAAARAGGAPDAGWAVTPAAELAIRQIDPAQRWRLFARIGQAVVRLAGESGPVWVRADLAGDTEPEEIEIVVGWQGGLAEHDESVARARGRLLGTLAALGGRMTLGGQAGQGELRMALPLRRRSSGPLARPRILLMDDEQPVREVAARILAAAHYDVIEAADGRAALSLFRKACRANRPFQLAVLDLNVPGGMGGEEAGRRLLEIDPDLPILISSGRMNGLPPQDLRRLGFCAVVPKPYTARELRSGVRRALGRQGTTTA